MSFIPVSSPDISTVGERKEATPLLIPPLSVRPAFAFNILNGYEIHGIVRFIDFNYRDVQSVISKRKLKDNECLAILMNAELYFCHQEHNIQSEGNVALLINPCDSNDNIETKVKFLLKKENLPNSDYDFDTNRCKLNSSMMEQFSKEDGNKIFFRTVLNGSSIDSGCFNLVQKIEKKEPVKKRSRLEREDPTMSDRIKKAIELLQEAKKADATGAKVLVNQAQTQLEPYSE